MDGLEMLNFSENPVHPLLTWLMKPLLDNRIAKKELSPEQLQMTALERLTGRGHYFMIRLEAT